VFFTGTEDIDNERERITAIIQKPAVNSKAIPVAEQQETKVYVTFFSPLPLFLRFV
jgi:carbon monoxide dehydrogenase subunit G